MHLYSVVENSYIWDDKQQSLIEVPTEIYIVNNEEVNKEEYYLALEQWEDTSLLDNPLEE